LAIYISEYQKLSGEFIEKFKGKVNWVNISINQKLNGDYIAKFSNYVNWNNVSRYQRLSEDLIEKYKNQVDWEYISVYQKLSEEFIEKYKNQVNWDCISAYQELSEKFIEKHKDKVHWFNITCSQNLSEEFITKYEKKIDTSIYNRSHKTKTLKQKQAEIKEYAEKYNLKYDDEYLYAFRNHDKFGSGMYCLNTYYEKGKYYRDWHCDMREGNINSFGLGIFPKGNTSVKVKISDWGLEVNRDDGKCRVWGFEVI